MTTCLFLVRHGATTLSAEDRFAGSTDVELLELLFGAGIFVRGVGADDRPHWPSESPIRIFSSIHEEIPSKLEAPLVNNITKLTKMVLVLDYEVSHSCDDVIKNDTLY